MMARWISMLVLLGVIGVTAVVMFQVMSSFLLPLFLASVLTVIFRPIHVWMLARCRNRHGLASLLTTMVVLLAVLAPISAITVLAIREGLGAIGGDVLDLAQQRVEAVRERAGLDMPFEVLVQKDGLPVLTWRELDEQLRALPDQLPDADELIDKATRKRMQFVRSGLARFHARLQDLDQLAQADVIAEDDTHEMTSMKDLRQLHPEAPLESLEEVIDTLATVEQVWTQLQRNADATAAAEQAGAAPAEVTAGAQLLTDDLRRSYARLKPKYEGFRIDLLGGPVWAWMIDLVNPDMQQIDSVRANVQRYLRSWLPSVAGQATALAGQVVLGLGIMTLGLYYFLKDGPAMLKTVMRLSPLDDRYEEELLGEFDAMSRAVVLATLLSALAQAVLGGIAYFLAGFDSLFLLTSLTFLLAMVPFVGAAAVWVPACLWLAFVEERFLAALVLLAYGGGVISMVDNFVKPYVLHGQSKLHPLLALLSVLGGVQVLGPIGILVGPMIVSFLQALLNILHTELKTMEANGERSATPALPAAAGPSTIENC